jgi:DNA-3-methyladenine glycosylase II
MGISDDQLRASLDAVAAAEPAFATALARIGYPEPRISQRGYVTLLRAIVGQQVSIKAAAAIWGRVDAAAGGAADPAKLAAVSDERCAPPACRG